MVSGLEAAVLTLESHGPGRDALIAKCQFGSAAGDAPPPPGSRDQAAGSSSRYLAAQHCHMPTVVAVLVSDPIKRGRCRAQDLIA